jgi:transcriptional regulator with GAF, ATPase, and Fis domain
MDDDKRNLPYRLIYELGNAFAGRLELEDLLGLVVRKCREVFDAEGVSVLLLDNEREEFYFPYFSDLDPNVAARLMEIRFEASKGVAGAVLRNGRSVRIDRVEHDPNFYSEIDKFTGFQTRSIVAALLKAADTRLGVIEVLNPIHLKSFTEDHVALLEALAQSIALAIYNATRVGMLRTSAEKLRTEVGALRRDLAKHDVLSEVIGTSPEMTEVFHLMKSAAAASSIAVLLEGETGTGKEMVARGIHRMSGRADKPFLAVNCAALSEHLLESELFGHRRGSFTGATQNQPGLFRAASGGVIFLDEIGEMPLTMQPTLLRVLQDGEIMSVGDTRPERVDVRVFSATNRDLRAAVTAGTFRADLYYRLAAFPIRLPPLRVRRHDIPLLADRFLSLAGSRHRKDIRELDPVVLELFDQYEWPGNIRELQNEIERAVVLTPSGEAIRPEQLSADVRRRAAVPVTSPAPADGQPPEATKPAGEQPTLREARSGFEARFIADVLARNGGNVSHSAEMLGLSRIQLQRKMKDYGLR